VIIELILADDHSLFRSGLRNLLGHHAGLHVAGEAAEGREAIDQLEKTDADLVVMDLHMPGMSGIDATRRIRARWSNKYVLALSGEADAQAIGVMLEAGASGYLLKEATKAELVEAVRRVASGEMHLGRGLTASLVDRYIRGQGVGHGDDEANGPHEPGPDDRRPAFNGRSPDAARGSESAAGGRKQDGQSLTSRERQVLQMVAEGQSMKQIASRLALSVKTIESHRTTVMRKLSLPSVAHLTKYAIREGLVELDV